MGCQGDQRSFIRGSRINNSLGGTSRLDPATRCAGGKVLGNSFQILGESSSRIVNQGGNNRNSIPGNLVRHLNYIITPSNSTGI
jgi:hypothetical protein